MLPIPSPFKSAEGTNSLVPRIILTSNTTSRILITSSELISPGLVAQDSRLDI